MYIESFLYRRSIERIEIEVIIDSFKLFLRTKEKRMERKDGTRV